MAELSHRWRWRELTGVALLGIGLILLWRVPGLGWLAYPFRLFSTFVHESSHGLAAALSGGSLHRIVVRPDLSGTAWSSGGVRWIVASAGYLGSALFGSLLLLISRTLPARAMLVGLGTALAALSLFYVSGVFGMLTGLALAAALLLAGRYLGSLWCEGLLLLLALQNLLDGFGSLLDLFQLSRSGNVHTDAHTLATLSGIPAPLWAVFWCLFSGLITLLILRFAYRPAATAATDLPVRKMT